MSALASECPICYEEITKDSDITTLSCSHSFHLKCIAVWIMKSETCPCCRTDVSDHEKIAHLRNHTERARSRPRVEDFNSATGRLDQLDQWYVNRPIPILELPANIQPVLNPAAAEFVPAVDYNRMFNMAVELVEELDRITGYSNSD